MSSPRPLSAPVYSPTIAPISAKPNAVCRLARIQVVALGSTIEVRICRREAPRIRALSTRVRSTSRAPWKALKKTAKKTRTTAVATLRGHAEAEPDDEQRREHDPRDGVGGLDERARTRRRGSGCGRAGRRGRCPAPSRSAKPITASSRVTRICSQIEPCAVPSVNQVTSWSQMSIGREKYERVDHGGWRPAASCPARARRAAARAAMDGPAGAGGAARAAAGGAAAGATASRWLAVRRSVDRRARRRVAAVSGGTARRRGRG